jgi:putative aldouronate transport system permease protein
LIAHAKDTKVKRNKTIGYLTQNYEWYLFLIPGLVFLFLFDIMPMANITIAFKNIKGVVNLSSSPWVGLDHFYRMFADEAFFRVVRNTLIISLYKMIFILPLPLMLAILLNEVRIMAVKKIVQTFIYIPHFFTWVVVYSVFYIVFGSGGAVNTIITSLGGDPVLFFLKGSWFRFLLVISDAWHSVGWGTIMYLAAISAINSEVYEAAIVDGANKFKQMVHITLPCLLPTFVLMVSINLGHIMTSGFGQVLVFYNSTVYSVGDIISTYVYRTGLGQANFSYATAVGLFNSVIGFILVILSNWLAKVTTGKSVW